MLSANQIKFLRSLRERKYRLREQAFAVEGPKLVGEMLPFYRCRMLVGTAAMLRAVSTPHDAEVVELPESFDFKRISTQTTPQPLMAVFDLPAEPEPVVEGLTLLLDGVQDPGNVGTILRTADWFGIRHVWLGTGSADVFSPKVVQASMGALARVQPPPLKNTVDTLAYFRRQGIPVYGAFLEGQSLYEAPLPNFTEPAILVLGSEGRGISPEVAAEITDRLTIPASGLSVKGHTESLNVAIAAAILCSEWRRRS